MGFRYKIWAATWPKSTMKWGGSCSCARASPSARCLMAVGWDFSGIQWETKGFKWDFHHEQNEMTGN